MERIIVSRQDLEPKPRVLNLNISKTPDITVAQLLLLVQKHELQQPSRVVRLKISPVDYHANFNLQDPHFRISKLSPLPVELTVVFRDDNYIIQPYLTLKPNLFSLLRELGSGTFARVYLAETKYDQSLVSLKVINKQKLLKNGSVSQMRNQIATHRTMKNCLWTTKLFYAFEDVHYLGQQSSVYLAMEYCPNGDLFSQLKFKKFSEMEARIIFIQAVLGVTSLRDQNIVYRDIKPENFLVDRQGYLKLTDFGFALNLPQNQLVEGLCGSYEYMAPQMILKKPYTFSYDIYSLGILLYEILVGKSPFHGTPKGKVMTLVGKQIEYPQFLTPEAVSLISSMTQPEPSSRIGAKSIRDVLKHPWLLPESGLVNKVHSRQVKSPFLQIEVDKQISQVPDSKHRSQIWNLHYNHLQPAFEVDLAKFGPKFKASDGKYE